MTDKATKVLLAVIALGLFANAFTPLLGPVTARAADSFKCEGQVAAKAIGVDWPGGYSVTLDCK